MPAGALFAGSGFLVQLKMKQEGFVHANFLWKSEDPGMHTESYMGSYIHVCAARPFFRAAGGPTRCVPPGFFFVQRAAKLVV